MDLHPSVVAEQFAVDHDYELAVIHHYLSWAVPEAIVRWEDQVADPQDLDGSVLAADVRQLVVIRSRHAAPQLRMAKRRNCGLMFATRSGQQLRIRKRPKDPLTLAALPVSPPAVDTLFGLDYTTLSYELAVLWTINFRLRALGKAVLAAVDALDDQEKVTIYHEVFLPPAQEPPLGGTSAPPPEPNMPVDDFDDFLSKRERLGDDSA